tara:strand:+ start:10810 stop:11898 length:1089 start_codon:yes stop_codon:yes gene_type:complete
MNEITLTEEQQLRILEEWNSRPNNPPSLLELIQVAFPDEKVDGRSKEGKAVKQFLATRKIDARRSHEYKAKDKIELNEEQQEFVVNNAATMSANEMARVLFKNPELMPLSQETRTINDFIKTLDTKVVFQDVEDVPEEDYKPPKTFFAMVNKVNKYVHEGLNKDKMSPKQKKDVESLIGYLHTYRFLHHINNYTSQTDRELFESSFVRYTFDKYDLTQEEVDQYIVLSVEVVIAANIQRRVERLQELMDGAADDTDGRRIAMSLVEAISTNQTEYNQCVNRQHKLLGDLKEKRSDKLKSQIKENASILNLVQAWKEEDTRKQLIELAEKRKEIVQEEINKLSNMDEIKCRILGLGEDEALNG